MARENLFVRIELDRIHCHDEGDGLGSAEPYLWTIFFMIDGSTVEVTPALTLDGAATTVPTPGSHGNLGGPGSDVNDGDDVPIPEVIGQWQTIMLPIPVAESLGGLADDVGGAVGVITVLMEEDNVTDDGADAGHDGLNGAAREAINKIVATRTLTNQEVSDEEIAGFEDQISAAVEAAVSDQQNAFENVWSWLNPDDTIGFKAFIFSHDTLAQGGSIDFDHRWRAEGDWEIFGTVTASPICAAEALQELFDALLPAAPKSSDLTGLRQLRDGPFREIEGLYDWWKVMQRNAPAIIHGLRKRPALLPPTLELFDYAKTLSADLDAPLDLGKIEMAVSLARGLGTNTRSRRLKIDSSRAVGALESLEPGTVTAALHHFAAMGPSRRGALPGRPNGKER